jgi:hypothetical protein
MAEKIYVLDTQVRPVAHPRGESRNNAPAWQEAPLRRESGTRSEARPHSERASGNKQAPSFPHVAEDQVPEAWIKVPLAPGRKPFPALRTLAAMYGLGGVAPLALRVGPRQFIWAALAVVSLTTWVTLAWFWTPVRGMMTSGRLPILPCLVGLLLVHAIGALSWSRAVSRTVRDGRFQPESLPRNLRHPYVTGVLGMLLPGSGQVMAGQGTRAALALWNATMVTFAAVVLAQAGLLWTWNVKSGVDQVPPTFIESVFLASTAIVALGGLLWIGSALDGLRHAAVARRSRQPGSHLLRGDTVALALVLSLVAFATTFHPGQLAQDFDRLAGSLRWSGYRLVPLVFESVSARLDPGLPQYEMRVAELQTELGHPEKAQAIHDRLRERWEAYAQQLLQTAATGPSVRPGKPLQPTSDLVPHSTPLGTSLNESGASHAAQ